MTCGLPILFMSSRLMKDNDMYTVVGARSKGQSEMWSVHVGKFVRRVVGQRLSWVARPLLRRQAFAANVPRDARQANSRGCYSAITGDVCNASIVRAAGRQLGETRIFYGGGWPSRRKCYCGRSSGRVRSAAAIVAIVVAAVAGLHRYDKLQDAQITLQGCFCCVDSIHSSTDHGYKTGLLMALFLCRC